MSHPTQAGIYWVNTPWVDWQLVLVARNHDGVLRAYGQNELIGGTPLFTWPDIAEWHGPLDLKPPGSTP